MDVVERYRLVSTLPMLLLFSLGAQGDARHFLPSRFTKWAAVELCSEVAGDPEKAEPDLCPGQRKKAPRLVKEQEKPQPLLGTPTTLGRTTNFSVECG